jgi:hypothetical protein
MLIAQGNSVISILVSVQSVSRPGVTVSNEGVMKPRGCPFVILIPVSVFRVTMTVNAL